MAASTDVTPAGALTTREGFGTAEVTAIGDLAGTASAAAVAKEIEVRAILAERHPRNVEAFRQQILHYCRHPDFAEQALYSKKVGRKQDPVSGEWVDNFAVNFSIRFIEAALPLYRNIYYSTRVVFEDDRRLLVNVQVYDVEGNVGGGQDAMISKVVERKDAKDRTVLSERFNADGKRVYLVSATKDELRNVFGAERSKLIRDYGQKLLPFHVLAECRRLIDETNANEQAKDPDAAKKKVLDKFLTVGITADMLIAYLERPLDALTPKDIAELAVLFNGLRENEFTWKDIMAAKEQPAESAEPAPDSKAAKLREKILEARSKTKPKAEAPAPAESRDDGTQG